MLLRFLELMHASIITRIIKKYITSKMDIRLKPANNPSKPPKDAENIKTYYLCMIFDNNLYLYLSYRISFANCN